MTYEETLHFLYARTPAFHQVGAEAYKPGLERSLALAATLKNPQQAYQTIHVAGTNGKGSVSHLLAAILAEAGYRVGLYTSPHLVDFCERIRVNGQTIPTSAVVRFVANNLAAIDAFQPSFFELVSTLAYDYFREQRVDVAVIETGLGGRLDSTNIIRPVLSIVTNISADHMQFLGNSLAQIATEKAGIIKTGIPVVIGAAEGAVKEVFVKQAAAQQAPICFAAHNTVVTSATQSETKHWVFETTAYGTIEGELRGWAQHENGKTVFSALQVLQQQGFNISQEAVKNGFRAVTRLTGLAGRWQTVHHQPTVVCDTGHNPGAWQWLAQQLAYEATRHQTLRMVVGMVSDKEVTDILALMPQQAVYYFTQPAIQRAKDVHELASLAHQQNRTGTCYATVSQAVEAALHEATPHDLIFIGGSTFVVADALPLFAETTR